MGLRIAGNNLVRWCFDNVEINNLNLSLTGILKLNFVAYFLLRETFETTPSLPKTTEKLNTAVNFSPAIRRPILFRIWVWDADYRNVGSTLKLEQNKYHSSDRRFPVMRFFDVHLRTYMLK